MSADPRLGTAPLEVGEPSRVANDVTWQSFGEEFSFGSTSRTAGAGIGGVERKAAPSASATPNVDPFATGGIQGVEPREAAALPQTRRSLGRRAWTPVKQWEGIVESVRADAFTGRLTPIVDGALDFGRREIADFAIDELWYESDRPLVQPGGVFYWTIGLRQDPAGTRSYGSLVRFRRLSPPSEYRERLAAEEAETLLRTDGTE